MTESLEDIYELESEEENVPTATIQTQHGPIEIPVDENWHEYAKYEREYIELVVCHLINSEKVDSKEHFIDDELSVRSMMILSTFQDATDATDGTVVMKGDYGGQIYLTCPMKYVKCRERILHELLYEIDELEWSCNQGFGVEIKYRRAKSGDGVSGGIGGGLVEDGLWIHPDICPKKTEVIKKVISGELDSIN